MKQAAKIYIAGDTGLVGSALKRALQQRGYSNIVTRSLSELDLRNQKAVNSFFEQVKPDYVFLAAAKVGGIQANKTYPAEFIYDNLMIATNVIHAAYKVGVKKLLNLGSSCIYPKLAPQPLREEYLLTGPLEPTNEPYAIAKIAAIKLCQFYNEQYGTNFISVMPTNLYGPHDNFDLETAHVLPTLIRKFHLARLLEQSDFDGIKNDLKKYPVGKKFLPLTTNQEITERLESFGITKNAMTLWGTGTPYREFLYVDDLAQACIFLMQRYNRQQITPFVNIGTGQDLTIKELALLIKKITGFTGDVTFDSSKPDGTPKKQLVVEKIDHLGWKHTIDLPTGINKTYQWYEEKLFQTKERGVRHEQA